MKVWVASNGQYSDLRISAVCATKALAAELGENEPQSFEVYSKAPKRQMLYVVNGRAFLPTHPTNWSNDVMERGHFHTGDPSDCASCNPGHVQAGPCPGCELDLKVSKVKLALWPWDDRVDLLASPPKINRGTGPRSIWWSVEGRVEAEVDKAAARVLAAARKVLLG